MHDHLKNATDPKSRWFNRPIYQSLRNILFSGKTFSPRVVFESTSEEEALNEETRRINLYGVDNLLNSAWVRPGFGKVLKPFVKEKIAEAVRQLWKDPKYREKTELSKVGHKYPYRPKPGNNKPRKTRRGSSNFKGVSLWKVGGKKPRWLVRIVVIEHTGQNKLKHLGYANTPEEGAILYDNASEKYFGTRPNNTCQITK